MNRFGQIIPMFPWYQEETTSGRFLFSALIATNIVIIATLLFAHDSGVLRIAKGMLLLVNGFALLLVLTTGIEWVLEKLL